MFLLRTWPLALFLAGSVALAEPAPKIRLEPMVTDLERPVSVADDGTGRLFVVEQPGRVRLIVNGKLQAEPYLDIHAAVFSGANECGLLCVVFHPRFQANGRFFVNYTTRQRGKLETVVSEFKAGPKDTQAQASTERVILRFDQPWENHNGGQLAFGPDGKLYIAAGDGGAGGDPQENGQNLNAWLGKIHRIDVDGRQPYSVPSDNPFYGRSGVRQEIWAFGMRNPWRFSFDRKTGQLWAADVGQNLWEEIDIIERGKNYGWSAKEGTHPFEPKRAKGELTDPVKDYGRQAGISVTGGYVYRGKLIPGLEGMYVYGDYTGPIYGLKWNGKERTFDAELMNARFQISSFGEDKDGELYICDHNGGRVLRILRLVLLERTQSVS